MQKDRPCRIIVACSRNRVIGRDGLLPWQIPLDWQYFLQTTLGGTLILGRRCYEEMLGVGSVTADRNFVVVSKQTDLAGPHTVVAANLSEALSLADRWPSPVWICGGQRIYEEALPLAEELYLTLVHAEVQGDTFFPEWRQRFTHLVSEKTIEDSGYRLTFFVLRATPYRAGGGK